MQHCLSLGGSTACWCLSVSRLYQKCVVSSPNLIQPWPHHQDLCFFFSPSNFRKSRFQTILLNCALTDWWMLFPFDDELPFRAPHRIITHIIAWYFHTTSGWLVLTLRLLLWLPYRPTPMCSTYCWCLNTEPHSSLSISFFPALETSAVATSIPLG